MRRIFGLTSGFLLAGLLMASPASAQAVQSFHFGGGWFSPRGFDSRATGDVLVANLTNQGTIPGVSDALLFEINEFRTGTVFGEWTVTFGDRVEVGAGISFMQRSVPSVYRDLVNRNNTEIEQDIKLRSVPIVGVVRFLPFGRARSAQPYIGVGGGTVRFRYSEIGQFIDPEQFTPAGDPLIFDGRFIATGSAPALVFLGGLRLPMGGDIYALNLEYRYLNAVGNTGGTSVGFIDDKIDLSGGTFTFGFQVRF